MRDESSCIYGEVNKNLWLNISSFPTLRRVPTDWKSLLRYTILCAIFRTAQNDAVRVVWEFPKWYKTTGQAQRLLRPEHVNTSRYSSISREIVTRWNWTSRDAICSRKRGTLCARVTITKKCKAICSVVKLLRDYC